MIHHDTVRHTRGCKGFSINANQSVGYTTLTNWRIKAIWSSQQIQKKLSKKFNPFMIKTLQKVGIEGSYLNIIKAIYDKSTLKSYSVVKCLKGFSVRSRIRQGYSLSPLLFNIVLEVLATPQQSEKKKKSKESKWEKNINKWSLFADDTENPKDSTRKLLEFISEFGKVAVYK